MNKLATIKVQGGEYATVPTRLKAFLEANPRAKITTEDLSGADFIKFKTTIKVDQADPESLQADGHAMSVKTGMKEYEKTETISLGRCLGKLGWLNDGQIASTEELEDFYGFRIDNLKKQLKEAKDLKELTVLFSTLDASAKSAFTELFSERKKELADGTTK